ncbi:MAG TPA: glycoside hydrolase family 38 C-terminal domain-containing protein [Ignavibacteriales bacterium]|nr:glycoside hydrolase family 38 C-terminal domain-containing protein [Ignavibacteriales bacterium]
MNNKVFHVISNTHWDREWRYPFQKNRQMLVDMIDNVLDILEHEPQYRAFHLDSQSIVLKDYLEIRPDKKDLLIRLVEEKRLLVGPWYILPDEFQVGGENLIRNLLLGHKTSAMYGGVSKIGYSPFSWGQISQLPQIYKQFDIDLIMFYRGVNSIDSPRAEFLWEGADGEKMVSSRFSTMPRYNFYFYIYRPVIHNESIPDVEYKWSKGGMPFHFADKNMYGEDYSIIVPLDSYYSQNIKPSVESIIREQAHDFTTRHVIWMEGHDSSGPNAKTARIISDINNMMPGMEVKHSTLEEYADAVLKSVDKSKLKLVRGERRSAQFDRRSGNLYGYTTSARMYIKQKNYEAEKWLMYYAEPFNAFSSLLGRNTNDNYLDIAWEYLIQNSAHDSIGGCSLDDIHDDMIVRYKHSLQISHGVFERAVKYISKNIDSSKLLPVPDEKNIFLTAFNPGNYTRNETVQAFIDVPKEFDKGSIKVLDSRGNELDIVVTGREACQPVLEQLIDRPMYFEMMRYTTLLELKDIPAFGFRQFKVIPSSQKKSVKGSLIKTNRAGERLLENPFIKVKINSDGSFNVTDKESKVTYKNLGYFLDEGEGGHAWTHETLEPVISTLKSKPEIKIIEDNPLRAVFRIKHIIRLPENLKSRLSKTRKMVRMPVILTLSLGKNSRRLEFMVEVDNIAESHRLRMLFPTGLDAKYSYGEGQFDVVKRSIDRPDTKDWIEQPMYDYPMHHFVDVSDGANGYAVLSEGLKEYEVMQDKQKTLAVTLLRAFEYIIAPSSKQDYSHLKGSQCLGKHKYHVAFYPHRKDWSEGKVFEQALTFSNSISLVQTGASEGMLNPDSSFIEIFPKDLVFSALKKSEDGQNGSFILRLYNPSGKTMTGNVSTLFRLSGVEETTLEEKPLRKIDTINSNSFNVTVGKKKIVTLRIKFDTNNEGFNV